MHTYLSCQNESLVFNVQSLVLNVHLLYVQNQASKAFSKAFPCFYVITIIQISASVNYLHYNLTIIRILYISKHQVLKNQKFGSERTICEFWAHLTEKTNFQIFAHFTSH